MPYKIVLHMLDVELQEVHFIHAENLRDAKFKSLKFQSGKRTRKVDYLRMTELEVKEQCGVYED